MPYTQFLVVGATYGSPAHTIMQNGKIRIFDVIQSVNGKTCSDLFIPPNPVPQECFDRHLKDRLSIDLRLLHSLSLPPISDLLIKGRW